MATTLGPLAGFLAHCPNSLNEIDIGGSGELLLQNESHQLLSVIVLNENFRQKLVQGNSQWIFIAQNLREDGETLFGFENLFERAMFVELLKLDGVGPKMAAQIVALVPLNAIQEMLNTGKAPGTLKISGLGPKKLQSLASGLQSEREKFTKLFARHSITQSINPTKSSSSGVPVSYLMALQNMGLSPNEAKQLFEQFCRDNDDWNTWEQSKILRTVLQRWAQRRQQGINNEVNS